MLPSIVLRGTNRQQVDVSRIDGTNVIYIYPRTSPADGEPILGWADIPGAKGCTPQSCAYCDLYSELRKAGVDHVIGLSTQDTPYQQELRDRLHPPYVKRGSILVHTSGCVSQL